MNEVKNRPGYEEDHKSPLTKRLRSLRQEFGLVGAVLIDFTEERIGVCSTGSTDEFSHHMGVLGDRILAAIDDGKFDPDIEPPTEVRQRPDGANPHLINGDFQSDKYPTTPLGKVPLSTKDPMAQDLLAEYARRRRAVDADFSDAVEAALRNHGYKAK